MYTYRTRTLHSRSHLESAVQIKSAPNAGYTRKKGPISVYYPHQSPEKFINTHGYGVHVYGSLGPVMMQST